MKLYDKLAQCLSDDKLSHHQSWAKIEGGPFLVTTIEELSELWDAAGCRRREVITVTRSGIQEAILSPDLTTYLQSKGINI